MCVAIHRCNECGKVARHRGFKAKYLGFPERASRIVAHLVTGSIAVSRIARRPPIANTASNLLICPFLVGICVVR